jgi:restriction endonuclease S subunit
MANLSFVRTCKIPIPPPPTQEAILIELKTEQAMVDANKDLIARFEKKIQAVIDRVWGGGTAE